MPNASVAPLDGAAGGSADDGASSCVPPLENRCAAALGSGTGAANGADGAAAAPTDAGAPGDAGAPSVRVDAGANDTFSPCPSAGSACVIMPFGDSITEGYPSFDGGYRVELFRQALLGSQAISFVGDRMNGPASVDGQPFPRGNEGYSGYTIEPSARNGISVRAEPAIMTYQPDIILLMIGTNDVDLNVDVAGAPARLGALMDRITSAASDALLVVAQILPTRNAATNERIRAFDAAIPGLIAERQAAGKHVVGADMYAAFTSNPDYGNAYLVDDLHPNAAGYALIGQTWYEAIRAYLPPTR